MDSPSERLVNLEGELDGGRAEIGENVRFAAGWFVDFPFDEAGFRARAVVGFGTVAVAAGHGGLVERDDFVGGAVKADAALIDPEDAMTEAANLIELVRDEDDCAPGAGDSAHFPQALFLEIDIS